MFFFMGFIADLYQISLGKFHHGITVLPSPGNHWLIVGKSSPLMAARFMSVKYSNIPRKMEERLQKRDELSANLPSDNDSHFAIEHGPVQSS